MKQVLVIDKDTVEEYVTKFSVDDIERDAIEHFIKHHNPGNLLASFRAEVGSVFGHYTGDPKGDQVELKIVAIPDGLEGEQIEKGKEYHVLILACADEGRASDEGSEVKK